MTIGPNSAKLWNDFKDNLYRVKQAIDAPKAEEKFYALPFETRALAYMVADRWQAPGHHDHEVLAQDVGIAIAAALQMEPALTPSPMEREK